MESLTALTEDFKCNWELIHYIKDVDIHAEYAQEDDKDDDLDELNDFNIKTFYKQISPSLCVVSEVETHKEGF